MDVNARIDGLTKAVRDLTLRLTLVERKLDPPAPADMPVGPGHLPEQPAPLREEDLFEKPRRR